MQSREGQFDESVTQT
nr:unnamed protein product [Callosobruchus chinensis]